MAILSEIEYVQSEISDDGKRTEARLNHVSKAWLDRNYIEGHE